MKDTIFSGLSCTKMQALLESYTAPSKKEMDTHVWIAQEAKKKTGGRLARAAHYSGRRTQPSAAEEWACLIGTWNGNVFRGKLYRSYDGQFSGGIALPELTLTAGAAGNLGQLSCVTGWSVSFRLFLLFIGVITLLLAGQIVTALPAVTVISIVAVICWAGLCVLMIAMFYGQYRHECRAVGLTLKKMVKAFD